MTTNNMTNNSIAPKTGLFVNYTSANWYRCGIPLYFPTQATTASVPTGNIYFHQFYIAKQTVFTDIGCYVGTGISGNINMCLYGSNVTNLPTGSPIANSTTGSLSSIATGIVSATFSSPITLNPGIYWAAISTSATISLVSITLPTTSTDVLAGFGNPFPPGSSGTDTTSYSQTFTYSTTFPAIGTLSALQPSSSPGAVAIWLKAQ